MNEHNLFASVVLFRELYDNDKDIYDVISEFIIGAICYTKRWAFNSTEITKVLEDTFDFKIPESVIKTTLKKRLTKDGTLSFSGGIYSLSENTIKNNIKYDSEFVEKQGDYNELINSLVEYTKSIWTESLNDRNKEELISNFNSFLTDNTISEKYSSSISSFIIENQDNSKFKNKINAIKEGLILYNGIRYTSNLNELGSWNSDLTIYLDTEHLFNSEGLNGILYKELFDDFHKLIKEINGANKSKLGKNKVELKYFIENKEQVDNFFFVAEQILLGKATLDPSKTAMISIVNGCRTPSDIIRKKAYFYENLKKHGINCDERTFSIKPEYNIEDQNLMKILTEKSKEHNRQLDEEECYHFLRIFSKINYLRHGVSNEGFEKIGFILMSGKSVAHFIAHSKEVKFQENDIPFATDIDYITNKFWFKLKKGLSNKTSLPKSFDIVTKAQIVLSSQINNTISSKYSDLTKKFKAGLVSKDDTIAYHHELRNKVKKPEEIGPENIENSLIFLSDNGFESYKREKSILEGKLHEGEKAIRELKKRDFEIWTKKKNRIKKIAQIGYLLSIVITNLLIFGILILLIILLVTKLITPADTILSITGFFLGIIIELIALFKYYKKLLGLLKRKSRIIFCKMLQTFSK